MEKHKKVHKITVAERAFGNNRLALDLSKPFKELKLNMSLELRMQLGIIINVPLETTD